MAEDDLWTMGVRSRGVLPLHPSYPKPNMKLSLHSATQRVFHLSLRTSYYHRWQFLRHGSGDVKVVDFSIHPFHLMMSGFYGLLLIGHLLGSLDRNEYIYLFVV